MNPTRNGHPLVPLLEGIDGRGYKGYKELAGAWRYPDFVLTFDHVQGDPFADPSRVTVEIDAAAASLPATAYRSEARRWGTAALLARTFRQVAGGRAQRRGSGRSGTVRMESVGQIVLPQTAVRVDEGGRIEARFAIGLPADGRRISAREAVALLTVDVPDIVGTSLFAAAHPEEEVERCAAANEDAEALRRELKPRGLVAFVADGALLPRRSGVEDAPLQTDVVVPFTAPPSLRVSIDLPNAGPTTGMGVPEGVVLIVGGGFHGKSTLLQAIQSGVYNHRPGDGRELVVSRSGTVKVRAEDGRSVAGVDISSFIDGLPLGRTTTGLSTENASGSTSQAAAIVEAWEAGARVLLLDEDTSATNFMLRDRRMQELVPSEGEPITPFIDRVRTLHRDHGISTVLIIGGSGDYLDVADHVIRMRDYLPEDVTARARAVADEFPTGRVHEGTTRLGLPRPRRAHRSSIDPSKGRRSVFVRVPDGRTLVFGSEAIDLEGVEQFVLRSQIRAVGLALALLPSAPGERRSLPELLDWIEERIEAAGLDALNPRRLGTLAAFRRFELAAALNRLRSLEVD